MEDPDNIPERLHLRMVLGHVIDFLLQPPDPEDEDDNVLGLFTACESQLIKAAPLRRPGSAKHECAAIITELRVQVCGAC